METPRHAGFVTLLELCDLLSPQEVLDVEVLLCDKPQDPLADGPVIQAASQRALEAGTTLDNVLEMVAEVSLRQRCCSLYNHCRLDNSAFLICVTM